MTSLLGRARSIKGADDLLKLSKALKAAGQTGLRNELHKDMRNAAKPLAAKVKAEIDDKIGPHRGGIGQHYAKKPVRPQVRTGAKTAGVRLVMPKTDPRVDSQGRVFHPVFGRPGSGVVQTMPEVSGFFSESAAEHAPEVIDDLREAFAAFLERFARSV